MLNYLATSPWLNHLGWVLVHSLWQFALVALLALALVRALKRQTAATRYAALLACLALVIALPLATGFALGPIDSPTKRNASAPTERPDVASRPQAVVHQQTAAPRQVELPVAREAPSPLGGRYAEAAPSGPSRWWSAVQSRIQPWLPQIVMLWIAGVLVAALRPLVGLHAVHRLRTVGVSPAPDAVEALLRRTAERLGIHRAVAVLQSVRVDSPLVVGYVRPVVLLPLGVVTGLPQAQLESILAHELAHVRRGDYAVNLLQTVVETIFFYHPAVWWLSRQIRRERENCCDDVAMASLGNRLEYGRALLAIAELRAATPTLSLAAGGGSLVARVRRIVDGDPAPRSSGVGGVVCLTVISIATLMAATWAAAQVAEPAKEAPDKDKPAAAAVAAESTPAAKEAGGESWPAGQVLDLLFVDAHTKQPLPDVKLELQFAGKGIDFSDVKIQQSDAQGRSRVRLPDRRPSSVRVYPSKPGYVPMRIYWDANTDPPLIPKTETVAMQPGTPWGGIVRNERGEPIVGAKVRVHYWETVPGEFSPHLRANIDEETFTGDDGRWRIDVMPEKLVEDAPRIFLMHPDYVSDHLQRGITPLPITEQPSIEALRAQTSIMTMRKGGTVSGRVVDAAGQPIQGAVIHTEEHYSLDPNKLAVTTGRDGDFEITNVTFSQSGINDPPPDVMRAIQQEQVPLVVLAPGYTPKMVHTDPSGADSPLEIELTEGHDITGRVLDQEGNPLAEVTIAVSNWLGYSGRLSLKTKSGADGTFRVVDAPAENATYAFRKKGYISVYFPMSPPKADGIQQTSYEITLKNALTISGSIVDAATGKPIEKCKLFKGVEYNDGRAPEWHNLFWPETITDGQYQVEFSNDFWLPRLRIEAPGYLPAVSRIFRPDDSDVGQVTYNFELTRAEPLWGTVVAPDGKPLPDAEVYLATNLFVVKDGQASADTLRAARRAKTDAQGEFELAPEVERYYLIVLHDQGYATVTEADMQSSPRICIQPWSGDRNFRVERSPFRATGSGPAIN